MISNSSDFNLTTSSVIKQLTFMTIFYESCEGMSAVFDWQLCLVTVGRPPGWRNQSCMWYAHYYIRTYLLSVKYLNSISLCITIKWLRLLYSHCNTRVKSQDSFSCENNHESVFNIACFVVDIYPMLVRIIELTYSGKRTIPHYMLNALHFCVWHQ